MAIIKTSMTVKEFLSEWFDVYSKPNIKHSTAVSYECYIRKHVNPEIGDIPLNEVSLHVLQIFFNRKSKELSPKTVSNLRMMLHAAFKVAYLNDLVSKNYIEYVTIPKVLRKEMRVLSKAEQEKLMITITNTDEPYAFGIFLCLSTGIRVGELCALTWDDIDFTNKILKIRKTLQRLRTLDESESKTKIYIGSPKTQSGIRDIPLSDSLISALQKHRNNMSRQYGKDITSPDAYIVTKKIIHPTEPKIMQDYFAKAIEYSGITKANFHSLRHTFATRALEAGIDFKTLSILLGHADIYVTINRYAHVLDEQKRKAMNEITSVILSP